jgi:hypothetical protein
MKHEQPLAEKSQSHPSWPVSMPEPIPQPPIMQKERERPVTRYVPRARKRGFLHVFSLQIAGLCCCALFFMLAALVWGFIVYSQQGYITAEGLLPLYLFLGAIFLSSCLMTVFASGGSIIPPLLFSLLANVISLWTAELSFPKLSGIFMKMLLSLLCAALGFTLTKLMLLSGNKRKKYSGLREGIRKN